MDKNIADIFKNQRIEEEQKKLERLKLESLVLPDMSSALDKLIKKEPDQNPTKKALLDINEYLKQRKKHAETGSDFPFPKKYQQTLDSGDQKRTREELMNEIKALDKAAITARDLAHSLYLVSKGETREKEDALIGLHDDLRRRAQELRSLLIELEKSK